MQGLFFESDTTVRLVLRFLVMLLGFWTAWRTGKAAAEGWNGYGTVFVYVLGLGFAMRFLHYSLFAGPFVSPSSTSSTWYPDGVCRGWFPVPPHHADGRQLLLAL